MRPWFLVVPILRDAEAGQHGEGGGESRRAFPRDVSRWRPKASAGRLRKQSGRWLYRPLTSQEMTHQTISSAGCSSLGSWGEAQEDLIISEVTGAVGGGLLDSFIVHSSTFK